MFDLLKNSTKSKAKFGIAVTILVLTSACAHEAVAPANNDAVAVEDTIPTPEPMAPASQLIEAPKAKRQHKHHVASKSRKAHNSKQARAQKIHKHKTMKNQEIKAAATMTAPPAAPVIAPPPPFIPAQVAMETEPANGGILERLLSYWAYALIGGGLAALLYVAPKARRFSKPKRKLVYNG